MNNFEFGSILFFLIFIAYVLVLIYMDMPKAEGFETENMTAYENTLLKICMDYNIETFECYQIYGDIESTYEPPQ